MKDRDQISEAHKYYLWGGIGGTDTRKRLKSYYRVVEIPTSFPFVPKGLRGYATLKKLRKNDVVWAYLKKNNPKIADKICHPNFILDFDDFILTPNDDMF